jgi:hypothetical protein
MWTICEDAMFDGSLPHFALKLAASAAKAAANRFLTQAK